MGKTTIKELAAKLNLSIATVSRALRNKHEISIETKERVQKLAEELGYTPDLYASNLRSRKTKTIGVIIPDITNSFFCQVIDGIEEICRQDDYHVLIYLTHEVYLKEVAIARLLLDGRVDGILISAASSTVDARHIQEFLNRNIPVVFFDRAINECNTFKVITDDMNCSANAVTHLVEQGCSNITYLSFSPQLSIDQKRRQGFTNAAKKYYINHNILDCDTNDENVIKLLSEHLTGGNAPDGILASVERLSLLVYQTCIRHDISIPSQLKLVSFSNLMSAPFLQPSLTTITQPAHEMGRQACLALFKALKNNFLHENNELIIPSQLIKRNSSCKHNQIPANA